MSTWGSPAGAADGRRLWPPLGQDSAGEVAAAAPLPGSSPPQGGGANVPNGARWRPLTSPWTWPCPPGRRCRGGRGWRWDRLWELCGREERIWGSCCSVRYCGLWVWLSIRAHCFGQRSMIPCGLGCRRIVTTRVRSQPCDGNQRVEQSAGVLATLCHEGDWLRIPTKLSFILNAIPTCQILLQHVTHLFAMW